MKKSLIIIIILLATFSKSYCACLNSFATKVHFLSKTLSTLSKIREYKILKDELNKANLRNKRFNAINGSNLMINELNVLGMQVKFHLMYRNSKYIKYNFKNLNFTNSCE